jgi:hypothetical protein
MGQRIVMSATRGRQALGMVKAGLVGGRSRFQKEAAVAVLLQSEQEVNSKTRMRVSVTFLIMLYIFMGFQSPQCNSHHKRCPRRRHIRYPFQ